MERRYKNQASGYRAVKTEGLQLLPHTVTPVDDARGGYVVTVCAYLAEDVQNIRNRGFRSKLIVEQPTAIGGES